ncbi:MAG: pirin family protein [Actinomycetota bacterium]
MSAASPDAAASAHEDDAIELTIEPRIRPVGQGEVRRLLPFRKRRMVGPYTFLDVMGPETMPAGAAMNVDAHPHIGLSTLTYLFDGRIVHRDSVGSVQPITPGAVNWMTAGAGITHTERSHPEDIPVDRRAHGLQMWVALPHETEDGPAGFEHCPAADVPEALHGGALIRLAVGTGFGMAAPIPGSSPLILAELSLNEATVRVDDSHRERAVYAVDDGIRVAGQTLPEGRLAVLEPGTTPELSGSGRAVIIGGEPVGQRFIWWNFVHSDRDRLEEAKADWTAQRFPLVPGDHEPWVPLPS